MNEKKGLYIFLVFFFVFIGINIYFGKRDSHALKKNSVYTIATIERFNRISKRSSNSLRYTFVVNDVIYQGSREYNIYTHYAEEFIGKKFLLVYDSEDVNNNKLLLTRDDYNEYKMIYPDSLKWVDTFVFK